MSSVIKDLKSLGLNSSQVKPLEVFYEEEWTNLTPFMPGDYRGGTWRYTKDGWVYSDPQLAQAIKARMRYASLLALASFVKNPQSYANVLEETRHAFEVKIKTSSKEEKEESLHLFDVIFGSTKFKSLFNIEVDVSRLPDYNNGKWTLEEETDRYHALLRRTDKGQLVPIRPNSISIKVKLSWSDHANSLFKKPNIKRKELEELIKHSLEVALIALGVGKGATRGFGRFYKIRGVTPHPLDALQNLLESWQKVANSKIETYSGLKYVPNIITALDWAKKFKLRRIKTYNTVDDAIEGIGKAVMKSTWKKKVGEKFASGTNFHTWTLGLPRHSSIQCVCKKYEKPDKNRKEKYGYFIVEVSHSDTKDNIFCCTKEKEYVNCCLMSEHCNQSGQEKNDKKKVKVSLKEPRRQSPFIITPYKDANGIAVTVIPFVATDIWEDLVLERKLFHVGGHFVRIPSKNKDKKPKFRPCCNRHLVEVCYILTHDEIIAPPKPSKGCGCGKDLGGIRTPETLDDIKECDLKTYERLLEVTIDWLKFSLK